MKPWKERLFLILILGISIMAIIITASQIYELVSHDLLLDNDKSGISGSENNYTEYYGKVSQEINIELYEWNDNTQTTDIYDHLTEKYNAKENLDEYSKYNISVNKRSDGAYLSITLPFSINEKIASLTVYSLNKGTAQMYRVNESDITLSSSTTRKDKYEQSYNGETEFTITIPSKKIVDTVLDWYYPSLTFYIEAYYYDIQETEFSIGNKEFFSVNTNELLQKDLLRNSYYNITNVWGEISKTNLPSTYNIKEFIYKNVVGSYDKGKELTTLKCSIGEYYDEEGNLAVSTKQNDLPMLFDIGNLVIPYIAVADGKTEPLSIKLDGTPKVFKVTQIRPYFDGAFWQELILQEYYDNTYQEIKTYSVMSSSEEFGSAGSGVYIVEGNIEIEEKNVLASYVDDLSYEIHTDEEGQVIPYGTFWIRIIQNSATSYTVSGTNTEPNAPSNLNIVVIYKK